MRCNVISTGSNGNAVVIDGQILADCGVPFAQARPYAYDLRLVLLTHIHSDHLNPATVRRLHQERPALRFGCCPWLVKPLIMAGVSAHSIDVYELGKVYDYGSVSVEAFPLFHDVDNCGYKIHTAGGRAIYATDTATMDGVEAKDFDLYCIEANYTEVELEERIKRKTESGEFVYEYRAAASHLSREAADAWLMENAAPGKSMVVYLHGHKEDKNNAE